MVQIDRPEVVLTRFLVVDALILGAFSLLTLASPISSSFKVSYLTWYLVGAFTLWMIFKRKNWARRFYIVLTVLVALTAAPITLLPWVSETYSPMNPALPMLSYGVDVVNLLVTIVFTLILMHPAVRSLFTPSPPKRTQRIVLGVVAVLALLAGSSVLVLGG